ncbi:Fumble domain protein [Allomeiothermus silvanus DSM 9946]|uniref:Fumble domain protein n=1 Tax=Allomeiothermus silvanus (strain ATCC 700542 / DSM 9946 / NBRC 106475 / NCIMB 13440 / VI-R2) TaxID=526227 RepID=D7BAL2_ALLS1|nr:Fumble domain-containing protein [Allomeiothermus silvanus]ADH62534.1 Fumble domain protein [Allomeiothermus silvanus DSM 9946]
MAGLRIGIDFGLTNTDVVLVRGGELLEHWVLPYAGPASEALLYRALAAGNRDLSEFDSIATTGGLHRTLPDEIEGVPIHKADEAESVGRGGLALAGLEEALVVSAGTGTAMIAARGKKTQHLTGSAVGGGTLLGLSKLLIGTSHPLEVAHLAALGDPAGVDSTLKDAIGGGIGHLPASATAVNFGKVGSLPSPPKREDIAAGLVVMVGQVIGVVALSAAQAAGLREVVVVGHLPDLEPVRKAILAVWEFYQAEPQPLIPERSGAATALGAVLATADQD